MEFEDPKNRYALSEVLHSSSRVRTYRGVNPDSGEPVTVKVLSISDQDPQGILGRVFLDRSMILSHLEHPSLPVLLEAGLTADRDAFLVFDWVEGTPVSVSGPFPPTRALPLMVQVLEGLECLALHNLVHWNITPDNLILNEQDELRLVGIGASLLPMEWWPTYLDSQPVSNVFIAPELRRIGVSPSSAVGGAWWRGDLFSVAMVTCTLLGARVHGAGTAAPKVETLPGSRTALHELLEQCLLEDPNERPISFTEVIKVFQHVSPRDRSAKGDDVRSTHSYNLRNQSASDRARPDRRSRRSREIEAAQQAAPAHGSLAGSRLDLEVELAASAPSDPIEPGQRPPSPAATVEADPDVTQKIRGSIEQHGANATWVVPQQQPNATVELDPASVARQVRGAAKSATVPEVEPDRLEEVETRHVDRQALTAVPTPEPKKAALTNVVPADSTPVASRAQAPAAPERLRSSAEAPTLIETIRQSIMSFLPDGDPEPRADLLEDVEDFDRARDSDGVDVASLTGQTPPPSAIEGPPPSVKDLAAPVRTPSSGAAPEQDPPRPTESSSKAATLSSSRALLGRLAVPMILASVLAVFALLVLGLVRILAGGGADQAPEVIRVSDLSAEPTVEVGPMIEAVAAPPPFAELPTELEEAIESFSNGDIAGARQLIEPLRRQERDGLLAPEVCDVLAPLAESVDLAWVSSLLDQMRRALASDDAVSLRSALNSLSAVDLRRARLMSGGLALLESSNRVLDRIDEVERLLREGQFERALEGAAALHASNSGMERQANLRERSAMGIEQRVDALNQAGRHDDAKETLARLESLWPDRGGLADRRASVERSEQSNELYQEMLRNAEATISQGRPHEGLAALEGAQPPYALVQQFASLEERLQQELARLDAQAPSVRADPTKPADYRKGSPFTVTLIARDDYQVISVEAFVRVEGDSEYRSIQVSSAGNDRFTFVVDPELHRDRPVEFYATARDRSGNEADLNGPDEPTVLKRKRWFRN